MSIKQLSVNNYAEINRIWKAAGLPTKLTGRDSFDNIKKQLKSKNVTILADELNGEIRGIVLLSHDSRKGWINRLAVLPKYQRQGIGSRLLKSAEEFFYDLGIEIYVALIEASNYASVACFKKNKYKLWDDIYYFSKRARDDI